MTPAPPTIEQRLADVEAAIKTLAQKSMTEECRVAALETEIHELLPLQIRNEVDKAVWRIEAEVIGQPSKLLNAVNEMLLPSTAEIGRRLAALEGAKDTMEDKLASLVKVVGQWTNMFNPSTMQALVLLEVLIDRGLLKTDFAVGVFEREKARQTEIKNLNRLWQPEHPGGDVPPDDQAGR
ncbi:MAG: hypothetical protein Q7W02_00130 [Candidatus Rokubacteria bacterium]|nr:hypothetical protein [Candidatus Rokubacteria bacterium]